MSPPTTPLPLKTDTPLPCPDCNGYGSADGKPCGTRDRDFGPNAPGPCDRCGGTGNLPPSNPTK